MMREPNRKRRRTGRSDFVLWMLATAMLLAPTQWLAYRVATGATKDQVFPVSEWADARYFESAAPPSAVPPISRSGLPAAVKLPVDTTPQPGQSATPKPEPTGSPTPQPTITPSPTPPPNRAPAVDVRANPIPAPDGSNGLFYRYRIDLANPSDGDYLSSVEVVTQVPVGTQRVSCTHGFANSGDGLTNAQCSVIAPPASEDGHNLVWDAGQFAPGSTRSYTFDVRVTAPDGSVIKNHAHAFWQERSKSVDSPVCAFVVDRTVPRSCSTGSVEAEMT